MIVTAERYLEYNPTNEYGAAEIERIIDIAEQVVEYATCGRTREFKNFKDNVKEKVVKAICAQTDFILKNFGADLDDILPESATIGSFSYSTGGSKDADIVPSQLNHVAKLYLQSAGLLYRGGVSVAY